MVKKKKVYPSIFLLHCPKYCTSFQEGRKDWRKYLLVLREQIEISEFLILQP